MIHCALLCHVTQESDPNVKSEYGKSQISLHIHLWFNNKTLRKHAYSNILRILSPKNENSQMKNSGSFHMSAHNIDCGYSLEPPLRGGSNEYPQSMFLSRNKKNNA